MIIIIIIIIIIVNIIIMIMIIIRFQDVPALKYLDTSLMLPF